MSNMPFFKKNGCFADVKIEVHADQLSKQARGCESISFVGVYQFSSGGLKFCNASRFPTNSGVKLGFSY
jgi:hypothetical protein